MSEAAIPANTNGVATAPAANDTDNMTVEQRADALFGASEAAGDAGSTPTPSADTASPAASEAPKTPEQLAAERAERRKQTLADLNARRRASVDASSAQRQVAQLQQQLAEAQQRMGAMVDPTQLDPLRIIELGQRAGHTPAQMVEAIKNAMGSPELAAAHAAKQAVDPVVAKLQQQLSDALGRISAFEQRQQASQIEAAENAAHEQFAAFAQQNANVSPLAARFLEHAGAQEFRKLVEGAAQALPPNAGPQALLDEIEDRLTDLGKLYAAPAAPQRTSANPTRMQGTAAQAPTHVTNTLAQQRSHVVPEGAELENLSLEERAALLFGT